MPAARQTDEELADPDPPAQPSPPRFAGSGLMRSSQPNGPICARRAIFCTSCARTSLSLKALGGDPVSEEYLKADLYRRAEALKDIPGTPLFFGRLDYPGPPAEHFHIGRRHVHDQQGHPMVIDWRAPVSRPFYRASSCRADGAVAAAPVRVLRRRAHRVRGRGFRRRA